MSAAVCGKRPFFEDTDAAIPPAYKRLRCSSWTSPTRFTYSRPLQSSLVDQLRALFPYTEIQSLEKSISSRANAEVAQSFHKVKENLAVKEQIEVLPSSSELFPSSMNAKRRMMRGTKKWSN